MFELPTQPPIIVLEIANVCAIIVIKQNDNDTDQKISENESEDSGESTFSSDIEDNYLPNHQDILHLNQERRDKAIRTTRVPLPQKRSY